jgi:hypothetical protein
MAFRLQAKGLPMQKSIKDRWQALTPRWRQVIQLPPALFLADQCLGMFTWESHRISMLAVVPATLSILWLLKVALYDGPRESWLYRKRRQLTLSLVSTWVGMAVLLVSAAFIHLGTSPAFRREHFQQEKRIAESTMDDQLGWAPAGPPEYVGQRLNKIDPAREHILIIGDSILYGHGVEEAQTAVYHVNEHFKSRYQTLNLSVSGYSPDQYYLYLRRVLPLTHPKAIVIGVFGGNDFQFTAKEWNYGHSKPLFTVKDGALVRIDEAGRCLDSMSQSLLFKVLWRDVGLATNVATLLCQPKELPLGQTEQVLLKIFDAIEDLGHQSGAKVIFMLEPVRDDLYPISPERSKYTSKYADLKRLILEGKHDLFEPYLDLMRTQPKMNDLFMDPGHYTIDGNKQFADAIVKRLESGPYLPPPPLPKP